jgi:hypothetical protein
MPENAIVFLLEADETAASQGCQMSTMELRKHTRTAALDSAKRLFEKTKPGIHGGRKWSVAQKRTQEEGELVSFLIRTVAAPSTFHPAPSLATDLGTIEKAAKVILEAVGDGTLTAPEGDAVLTLLTENFAARRVNRIFERISDAPKFEWFMTQARAAHER